MLKRKGKEAELYVFLYRSERMEKRVLLPP